MNLFGRKASPAATPVAAPVEEIAPSAEAAPVDSLPADSAPADDAAPPVDEAAAEPPVAAPAPAVMSTAARLAFLEKGPAMTSTPPKPPVGSLLTGAARTDQTPRRMLDTPSAGMGGGMSGGGMGAGLGGRRIDGGMAPLTDVAPPPPPVIAAPAVEPQRRLTVGRDISLAGEIASCDVLVVEGTVEAKLRDGHSIEVTETGLFKGSVEIDDADIGGRFEGDIVVRNRLRVRSSGRIIGSIVYGELEVETGGQLVGSIKLYDPAPKAAVTAAAENADAPAAPQSDVQPAQVYTPTGAYTG